MWAIDRDERHLRLKQGRDELHVAGEPVRLRDDQDGAMEAAL
jgi:hypothetical protein